MIAKMSDIEFQNAIKGLDSHAVMTDGEKSALRTGWELCWQHLTEDREPEAVARCTDRQRDIYRFIRNHIRTKRLSPSMREVMGAFGIRSTNGIACHLRALERKGLIERDNNVARSIRLVGAA